MKRRKFLGLAGAALLSGPAVSIAQKSTVLAAGSPGKPLRVVVIANTYYEGDGLMIALCNTSARSPKLGLPYRVAWPRMAPQADSDIIKKPRCLVDVYGPDKDQSSRTPTAVAEIWCLDDLMSTKVVHGVSANKATAMKIVTEYGKARHGGGGTPDGVVAFGTAGYPDDASHNGCATIGSTVFIHDAGGGAGGGWAWSGQMEKLIPSRTPATFFSNVAADQATLSLINQEMLIAPANPAAALKLIIAPEAVAVSSVNIPKGTPYCGVDTAAVAAAKAAGATNITSVETTHGVIRAQWQDAAFIYTTAIPNRVCHFDEAGNYPQELASSHNAGIALKHLITYFVGAIV
jgi:hypothetical protein